MGKCPQCKSANIRRSRHRVHRRTWRQLCAAWFRCTDCSARFLATDGRLAAGWGSLVAAAAGLVALVLWSSVHTFAPPKKTESAEQFFSVPAPPPGEADLAGKAQVLSPEALREAAKQGDPEAQYRLGLELLQKYREDHDRDGLTEGVRLLEAAASADNPRAQITLGAMYEGGRGVLQDYTRAAALFERAARRGVPEGMLRRGLMIMDGKSGERDPTAAYVWLNLAAARGEERAEIVRGRLASVLSAEQLAQAQERSRALDGQIPRP